MRSTRKRVLAWGRGYSVNCWVGMCHWDSETLTLILTMFSCIVQPYSRLDMEVSLPYPRLVESQSLFQIKFFIPLISFLTNDTLLLYKLECFIEISTTEKNRN